MADRSPNAFLMSSSPTASHPNAAVRLNAKDAAPKAHHQRPQPDHAVRVYGSRQDRLAGGHERGPEPQPAPVPPHLKIASRFLSGDRGRDTSTFAAPLPVPPPVDARLACKKTSLPIIHASDDPLLNLTFTSAPSHDTPPSPVRTKRDSLRGASPPDHRVHRHSQPPRSIATVDPVRREPSSGAESKPGFNASLAGAGWESMQREVELLRRAVQDMHRNTKKQTKKMDELKAQLSASMQQLKEKDNEIATLKQRCSKSEATMNVVEASIQCQICMELPLRPFALAPCGHVLCFTCLKEWFNTAPGIVDDDDDEEPLESALMRKKTCPCCRTTVRHRPSPVFMVKAVATALLKDKDPGPSSQASSTEVIDDDPWRGIFPNSDDEGSGGEDDDESLDDGLHDHDDLDDWMDALNRVHNTSTRFSWSSDSEDEGSYSLSGRFAEYDDSSSEEEENLSQASARLVPPRWEPASVHINPQDYPLVGSDLDSRESTLSLLRRGCTWDMIQNFHLRYSHDHGIVISLNSIDDLYSSDNESFGDVETIYHVYLGWNITLDSEDNDGERYIHSILYDIRNRPTHWRVTPLGDGAREYRMLVRASEVEDYSTTDSEVWHDTDSDDEDD